MYYHKIGMELHVLSLINSTLVREFSDKIEINHFSSNFSLDRSNSIKMQNSLRFVAVVKLIF